MKNWKNVLRVTACLFLTMVIALADVQGVFAATRGFYFKYNGEKAMPGSSAEDFLEAAGAAKSTSKTNSCATKGYDYKYEYEDFILNTYTNDKKKNAKQYVNSIVLTSKNVKTPEGIKIGSKEKTVKKKYRNAEKNFGVYTKIKGNTKIIITVDDGKVSKIEIVLK